VTLTLSYSSKINAVLYPQRVSLLLKKLRDMSSKGYAAYPVGYNSPLKIKMAIWRPFFEFELAGPGVGAICRIYV
jgi:hypothetical protein